MPHFGVIAEFNPFHNGHKYLVDTLKSDGVSTVTAVLSGNFVQRGEPAWASVTVRTEAALRQGVDLVLSLPLPFSVLSAKYFALAGVTVLLQSGAVDTLAFGSESGDAPLLMECARALRAPAFSEELSRFLGEGLSYPAARERALNALYGQRFSPVLSGANDILGIEYCGALLDLDLPWQVKTVKRAGEAHDASAASGDFLSAKAIRERAAAGENCNAFLPEESRNVFARAMHQGKAPADFSKLEGAMLSKLRTMTREELGALPDVGEGLENRIFDAVRTSSSLEEILVKVKTKRYTHSRLRRILLCAFLGIDKRLVSLTVPYVRVLGFSGKGSALLKRSNAADALPVITRAADFRRLEGEAREVFDLECRARDLFSLALPTPEVCGCEMTDGIVKI